MRTEDAYNLFIHKSHLSANINAHFFSKLKGGKQDKQVAW